MTSPRVRPERLYLPSFLGMRPEVLYPRAFQKGCPRARVFRAFQRGAPASFLFACISKEMLWGPCKQGVFGYLLRGLLFTYISEGVP